MSEDLSRLVLPRILELVKTPVYVGLPTECGSGCGAVVRLVGDQKAGGAWHCPLCGSQLPYAFWNVKVEKDAQGRSVGARIVKPEELILQLAPNACAKCGEAPRCRCYRTALHEAKEKLQSDFMNAVDPGTPKALCEHCLQVYLWQAIERDFFDPIMPGRKIAMCRTCREAVFGVPQEPPKPPPPEPEGPARNILL